MRGLADAERIRRFMRALGAAADAEGAAYLTGGTTAVLLGWRASTIDVDIAFAPETDALLQAVSRLKHELRVNVELVSPEDFVPVPAGWEGRSLFAAREGPLSFYHYDLYSQALAKLERAHAQDLDDVRAMIERGLVEPARALRAFAEIEGALFRYPAVDGRSFRRRVEEAFRDPGPR
ncbi:MAG: hypothetical protein H0V40_12855 [Actinobacteria bacterium]|nr:hypothetical protein [Actinomycetota bacterium]